MNKTSFNTTVNSPSFHFEHYLLIWLTAPIGIVFTFLNLIRYFRSHSHRTHLTYIYHFSLGFSLILSLISVPLHTLTDWNSYQNGRLLCNFYLISLFLSSSGIGYSIAYASIEQIFFIFFSQNLRLTWMRQFTPFLILFSLCCLIGTLLILLLRCSMEFSSCSSCYFNSLRFEILWFIFQYLIPCVLMLIAMIFLIYRIEIHTNRLRTSLNRKRSRKKFQRILIHLNLYHLFYFLSIGPMHFYSFIRICLNLDQPLVAILLDNYIFISLQTYPILVFLLTKFKRIEQRILFQRQTPFVIIIPPSIQEDEYQRTRL